MAKGSTHLGDLERVLKAAANRRRLALLQRMAHGDTLNVSELSRHIGLSYRATSQHLRILDRAGLLTREQTRLEVFYGLRKNLPLVVRAVLREL